MQNTNFTELIAKKLAGAITEEECKLLDNWIELSKSNKHTYKVYEVIWSETKLRRTNKNLDNAFRRVSASISQDSKAIKITKARTRIIPINYIRLGIAASIILFVIAFSLFHNWDISSPVALNTSDNLVIKSIPSGQKIKIFLPDGSTVWLNAESNINYPKRFNDSLRIVKLEGEAFFEVVKDTLKPFIVQTGAMEIKVVGTSFNVNSYETDNTSNVALQTGKVMVRLNNSGSTKTILLSPGEGVVLDKIRGSLNKYHVNPSADFQWKDGVITFDKSNFNDVIVKLSRWYGVEFEVVNYHGEKWEYSAEFKNEYLSNVLQSMSFSKGFDFKIDQNKVLIIFN